MAVLSPRATTPTIAGVLARRGITADEGDLASALERALGRYLSAPGAAPLSAPERVALRSGGLELEATGAYAGAATRTAADYAALVATALTVPQAATRLGVDASRVRHRIGAGELWALHSAARRRLLPAMQFAPDGGLVPGLPEVLRSLPDDLHPLEVAGFLAGKRPELRLRGHDQSPLEWLLRGGELADVVAAAEGVRDGLL
jgi:hypothetical protein